MSLATLTKAGRAAIALALSARPIHLAWGSGNPESVTGPSPYLYVRTNYNFEDASNAVIREIGVFMDTELKEDLPPGQRYFTPDNLKSPGLLVAAQIIVPPINRSPSVRQTIEFVLPI